MQFQIQIKENIGSSYFYFEALENSMHQIACDTVNKEVLNKIETNNAQKTSPFYIPLNLPRKIVVKQYSSVFNKVKKNGIKFYLFLRNTEFNGKKGKFYISK